MARFDDSIARPTRLHPNWTTRMWISFIVAVIALTIVGLWPNGLW